MPGAMGNGFHAVVIALYGWLNKNGLFASLVTALATVMYTGTTQRLGKPDKRMSWTVLYDEPINAGGSASSAPWEISFQSRDPGAVLHGGQQAGGAQLRERHAERDRAGCRAAAVDVVHRVPGPGRVEDQRRLRPGLKHGRSLITKTTT